MLGLGGFRLPFFSSLVFWVFLGLLFLLVSFFFGCFGLFWWLSKKGNHFNKVEDYLFGVVVWRWLGFLGLPLGRWKVSLGLVWP